MRGLSLFTGAGGGVLGEILLGWEHKGYVEYDDYCQKIIAQRIKDGILDEAPIFGDIRTFISDGYAASYTGMVDVISAGFPCQPFSVAGKRAGEDDERNMWPATIECIRIIRPRYALLENVPGMLSSGYFQRILGDLAEAGYDAQWCVLGASDVGANHHRKRLWILAHASSERGQQLSELAEEERGACSRADVDGCREDVADTEREQARRLQQPKIQTDIGATSHRTGQAAWWSTEPDVGRVAHGVAARVDRLKALGNGQAPAVVRAVWELLK